MAEPKILSFKPDAAKQHQERLRIAQWLRSIAAMLEQNEAESEPTRAVLVLMGERDADVGGPPGTPRSVVLEASKVIYQRLTLGHCRKDGGA